jgi:class 3 adenylate cyclase
MIQKASPSPVIDLHLTVIAKTDIVQYSSRVATLSSNDLNALVEDHTQFILDTVSNHEGRIVKGEGDAFWIIFPSVTAACLAAVDMQRQLRVSQSGRSDDDRVSMRVAITAGDVLHRNGDIFGHIVNMTARIEAIVPADEIYLSQGAWLALNQAEIQTSFVSEFTLKGMVYPEKIYRVDVHHRTQIIPGQVVVFSDIRSFLNFQAKHSLTDVERLLMEYEESMKIVCRDHGGVLRQVAGDSYILTFSNAANALNAVRQFCLSWAVFNKMQQWDCRVDFGIHRGDLQIFRSYLFGDTLNEAARLSDMSRYMSRDTDNLNVFVSQPVYRSLDNTNLQNGLEKIDVSNFSNVGEQMIQFLDRSDVWLFRWDSDN